MTSPTVDRPPDMAQHPEPAGPASASRELDRRQAIARGALRILAGTLPDERLALSLADGESSEPTTDTAASEPPRVPAARIIIDGPDALGRVLMPPTRNAFAEAYLRGDLEIVGDVTAAIDVGQRLDPRRLTPADLRRLTRWALELRRGAKPTHRLQRAARLRGPRHSRARDLAAVRFHYDVGEAFYQLWLDQRLTYSCAYFASSDAPERSLDAAQEAKLELICRKLDLQPGQRLLDVGCGWGSLILFASQRHGVRAVGVTLSERQAAEANRRARSMGLDDLATAEVRDYRDLEPLGAFDAVASVGMFEHVGRDHLAAYFAAVHDRLVPGGRFLNHGIATTRLAAAGPRPNGRFVDRYVFPDGELVSIETAIRVAREADFELLDVQSLRPHYALTLTGWVRRLEARWSEAVAAAGDEVARTWRLYMSSARLGFEQGDLDVAQLLLARPGTDGPARRPLRPWW